MNVIENKTYDLERSLYNLKDTKVIKCIFKGKNDGESVLKEAKNIEIEKCIFSLRYPLWHNDNFKVYKSDFDEYSRAPIWYSNNGEIIFSKITSIKALRECNNIKIKNGYIYSNEFGWKCNNIEVIKSRINSEYAFFDSKNIKLDNVSFSGKYSFQYIDNLEIKNSFLNTKDAFWHSENVVVKDSVVKGEYLAWFSKNITFINCTIVGTQPFCYVENLKLVNCKMIDTDLAFEYSSVDVDVINEIESIKNPKSGVIKCLGVKEIINEDSIIKSNYELIIK